MSGKQNGHFAAFLCIHNFVHFNLFIDKVERIAYLSSRQKRTARNTLNKFCYVSAVIQASNPPPYLHINDSVQDHRCFLH